MLASCVMPDALTTREVAHIARLARLDLTPGEEEALARQLTDILAYAGMVRKVETSADDRVAHSAAESSEPEVTVRTDVPSPSLRREDAVAAAPDRSPDGAFFRVPKVL